MKDELVVDPDTTRTTITAADGDFLDVVVAVRKYGMRGDYETAESFIDTNFDAASRGGLVLEELFSTYRE